MFRKRNQRVRLWQCPVGRLHYTAQVVHPCYFFFKILCQNILKNLFFFQFILPIFYLSLFLTEKSTEEEAPWPLTKEEEDINTLWSLMQVGGFPAWPEEEAPRLLVEVGLLYPLILLFSDPFCFSASPIFPFWSFFAGVGFAEAG